MKFVNMTNEEGTFNITSENEKITANITEIHPEIIFEDNSMLILPNVDAYYHLIGDASMYDMIDQNINIETLFEGLKESDTVKDFSYSGEDVVTIFEIEYNDYILYYLQRSGLNPISNNK